MSIFLLTFFVVCGMLYVVPVRGQIVTVRPDCAAPGMSVIVELLAPKHALRPFGYDALDSGNSIHVLNPSDSNRIVLGPAEVSWNGRLIQVPMFVLPTATLGTVPIVLFDSVTDIADTFSFAIDPVQHLGTMTHDTTLGGNFGNFSAGNVLLVDSLIVSNAAIHFSETNPDTTASNPRLLPVVILSNGPVRLTNAILSLSADSLNGGPGGGGGGHGFGGSGGIGFTGGGSCPSDMLGNSGSDAPATLEAGGAAATGTVGGQSESFNGGGGGGTGAPYDSSGFGCTGDASPGGEFGGGSGGGQDPTTLFVFGGGGGGFGTTGNGGMESFGVGANGGQPNDGRFLVPMAGGSGGGAGNAIDLGDETFGGSGGGGGGAIELVSFDSIEAISTIFQSRGDSGTTGTGIAAGGGGGSGGAIYLASANGIRAQNSSVDIAGGFGGRAADTSSFNGGAGGLGRVRIDGPENLSPTSPQTSVWVKGISMQMPSRYAGDSVNLSGIAPDVINTTDSIRIYYRTPHTQWMTVDTIADSIGAWSKWVPFSHDSVLYTIALVKIKNPAAGEDGFDFEPNWLYSDAAVRTINSAATPFFVTADTLKFGTVGVGRCKSLSLVLRNKGEAPLVIGEESLSPSSIFSMVPSAPITIAGYSIDTVTVTFCPDTSGADTGTVTIRSNDSTNSPKTIVLIGAGVKRNDVLSIVPPDIALRAIVGQCASDTVLISSIGTDTVYLDSATWNDPPFTIEVILHDTALAPNRQAKLVVTFCPTDSGQVSRTETLDERQDSLIIRGEGILRRAAALDSQNAGTLCRAETAAFADTVFNRGNDTITLVSWTSSSTSGIHSIQTLLTPGEAFPVIVPIITDSIGRYSDTIHIQFYDTTLTTMVSYRVRGVALRFDSPVEFPFVCATGSDNALVRAVNNGADTVTLSTFRIRSGSPFALLDSVSVLAPGDTAQLPMSFMPNDTILHTDTLQFIASDSGCDTLAAIVLIGRGIDSGIAALPIEFGTVPVGRCAEDSLVVGNPCGPEVLLDSIYSPNPVFEAIASFPDTIPPDGALRIAFRFCPNDTGEAFDTVLLFPHAGSIVRALLYGIGTEPPSPWAAFTVSSAAARGGQTVTTTVTLDSASLAGTHTVRGVLYYNPEVVSPIGGSPNAITQTAITQAASDSVSFTTSFDFNQAPFSIESVEWMTLLGPDPSTPIGFTLTTDTTLDVRVNPGSIVVTDCTGLNGQFAAGGSYAMQAIVPNPASDDASVTCSIGYDGYAEAGLYDMTGRMVEPIVSGELKAGVQTFGLPISAMASGRYLFAIHSMGWVAAQPVIVDR